MGTLAVGHDLEGKFAPTSIGIACRVFENRQADSKLSDFASNAAGVQK